jgi:peptidoglycan LD-endopeptidase CwlK
MSIRLFPDDVIFLQRILRSAGFYLFKIDGLYGPKTKAAEDAFWTSSAKIAREFGSFDPRTEGNLLSLQPKVQALARQSLKQILEAGIEARIISGTRTYAAQNELFKRGRWGNPGPRVTNARAGESNHNFAIAWDIGIFVRGHYQDDSPLYAKAARVGLLPGLEWGGDWAGFPDQPHYQFATKLPTSEVRRRFELGKAFL